MSDHLLEVEDLEVTFHTRRGMVTAVRGVTFHIDRGETVGIVGESGSGKSVTAQAILGLTELPGRVTGGDVRWKGRSLVHGKDAGRYVASIRGKELAVVFQDPLTSLNPVFTVGWQIAEVLRFHQGMNRRQAEERTVELLDTVGIPSPRRRARQHPHEYSGGMCQRVMIAMALACEPELLIADEPTTALDVTIQAQILELIAELQQRLDLAVVVITHDLGVVAGVCHRINVMYAAGFVETGTTAVLRDPAHPYTRGLLRSTPRLDVAQDRLTAIDGMPPDLASPPPGCTFAPRCPLAVDRCRAERPALAEVGADRWAACWRPFEVAG